jgi:hypothetical protein
VRVDVRRIGPDGSESPLPTRMASRSIAELIDVSFRGIDLSQQRLPTGDGYVYRW